jgi:hypothetical protein
MIQGKDNYGKPKQNFVDKIEAMSDEAFVDKAQQTIWLSAFANNNPRSDYHWQADACYDEAVRRGKPELYSKAQTSVIMTSENSQMRSPDFRRAGDKSEV